MFGADSPEAAVVRRYDQIKLTDPLTAGYCCHLLRLFRDRPVMHARFRTTSEVLLALTDEDAGAKCFGGPILRTSRAGVRYALGSSRDADDARGESHRDLCLATFAEYGVPLSATMTVGGRTLHVSDLLADSVQHFAIAQKELDWTAVAYALYLPRAKTWENRDGEVFTLDDLADELLRRPFRDASCGGTHLLYGLTLLFRADAETQCLSDRARDRVSDALRRAVGAAVAAQAPEGFWIGGWEGAPDVPRAPAGWTDTPFHRLLMTGHLLEWLEMLPDDLQPPPHVFRNAACWLCRTLQSTVDGPTAAKPGNELCPRTHALCAVRNLVAP